MKKEGNDKKTEKKFISLLSDTTFKHLFKIEEYKEFFNTIIKSIIGIDIYDFKLYDAELNSGNKKRDYRLDILLVSDLVDIVISIEMNQFPSEETKYKNRLYVYALLAKSLNSGEDIKKKKVIQINFNNEKNPYISKASYSVMDVNTHKEIKDFKIHEVYLENYNGIRYNKDNKEEAYLSLFTANSYEELREIAGDDKEALKIVDELERLGLDDEFGIVYDNEVMQKKMINTARNWGYDDGYDNGYDDGKEEGKAEGLEEGARTKEIEIAQIMLKTKEPLEKIVKYTGLSEEEINNLTVE